MTHFITTSISISVLLAAACAKPTVQSDAGGSVEPVAVARVAAPKSSTAHGEAKQDPPAAKPAAWTQAELEAATHTVQTQIEELRGAKFAHAVPVKVADKKELVEYLRKREAKEETPEKLAADEMIAKLLGVIAPDANLAEISDKALVSQVAGFYDPESKSFALMDMCPKGIVKAILAHELDHALDDQLFDLDGHLSALAGNSDASLAFRCVCEGAASNVGAQWTIKHRDEFDMLGMDEFQKQANAGLADAPKWLWLPLLESYLAGACFLTQSTTVMAGQMTPAKSADIETAFRTPPRSSEQVLHPEKYWDAAKRDEPIAVKFDGSSLDAGWKIVREDTLGEAGLFVLTTLPDRRGGLDGNDAGSILSMQFTNAASAGWGGDRLALLEHDKSRCLQLVSRWDTARDAAEFFGALTALTPSFEAAAKGVNHNDAKDCGARIQYGADELEVILTIWSGVTHSERKALDKNLKHSFAAN